MMPPEVETALRLVQMTTDLLLQEDPTLTMHEAMQMAKADHVEAMLAASRALQRADPNCRPPAAPAAGRHSARRGRGGSEAGGQERALTGGLEVLARVYPR